MKVKVLKIIRYLLDIREPVINLHIGNYHLLTAEFWIWFWLSCAVNLYRLHCATNHAFLLVWLLFYFCVITYMACVFSAPRSLFLLKSLSRSWTITFVRRHRKSNRLRMQLKAEHTYTFMQLVCCTVLLLCPWIRCNKTTRQPHLHSPVAFKQDVPIYRLMMNENNGICTLFSTSYLQFL